MELIFRGVNDFFKGVDFLRETDGEKLHQEIMAAGYKARPVEELEMPFEYTDYEQSFRENDGRLHKVVRMVTFNGLLLPTKCNNTVSMAQCRPINFYRAKNVLQYDVTSKKAFVTEKQVGKSLGYLFRLIPITGRVLFQFERAKENVSQDAELLTTESCWREYLQTALQEEVCV